MSEEKAITTQIDMTRFYCDVVSTAMTASNRNEFTQWMWVAQSVDQQRRSPTPRFTERDFDDLMARLDASAMVQEGSEATQGVTMDIEDLEGILRVRFEEYADGEMQWTERHSNEKPSDDKLSGLALQNFRASLHTSMALFRDMELKALADDEDAASKHFAQIHEVLFEYAVGIDQALHFTQQPKGEMKYGFLTQDAISGVIAKPVILDFQLEAGAVKLLNAYRKAEKWPHIPEDELNDIETLLAKAEKIKPEARACSVASYIVSKTFTRFLLNRI